MAAPVNPLSRTGGAVRGGAAALVGIPAPPRPMLNAYEMLKGRISL
jgi:hypothetical protein